MINFSDSQTNHMHTAWYMAFPIGKLILAMQFLE